MLGITCLSTKRSPISLSIVLPEDVSPSIATEVRHNGEVLEGYLDVSLNRQAEFEATIRFEGEPNPQALKVQPSFTIDTGVSRTWIRREDNGSDNAPSSTGEHKVC